MAIAVVIGNRTIENGVGAATSSSSVPAHRSRFSSVLALTVTDVHTPMTAAPRPA